MALHYRRQVWWWALAAIRQENKFSLLSGRSNRIQGFFLRVLSKKFSLDFFFIREKSFFSNSIVCESKLSLAMFVTISQSPKLVERQRKID
jgi:hypothetical protein